VLGICSTKFKEFDDHFAKKRLPGGAQPSDFTSFLNRSELENLVLQNKTRA